MKLTVPLSLSTAAPLCAVGAGAEATLSAAAQTDSHDDKPTTTAIAAHRLPTDERSLEWINIGAL
jgi:hypothetical protein